MIPAEERKRKYQELEPPVWDASFKWLGTLTPAGGSKLEKAVNYALNHQETLCNYLIDGRCEIYGMNIWAENGNLMAEDYDLAYYFRVDGWIEYMPGFEWKEDYLFRVDVHQYFLSKPFVLDFTNEVTRMKGNDSLYAGLTEKGIAAEIFAHAFVYYATEDIKHLHPEIASINSSSGVIDIANFDDRIWKFEAMWDVFCFTKNYLIDHEIFK